MFLQGLPSLGINKNGECSRSKTEPVRFAAGTMSICRIKMTLQQLERFCRWAHCQLSAQLLQKHLLELATAYFRAQARNHLIWYSHCSSASRQLMCLQGHITNWWSFSILAPNLKPTARWSIRERSIHVSLTFLPIRTLGYTTQCVRNTFCHIFRLQWKHPGMPNTIIKVSYCCSSRIQIGKWGNSDPHVVNQWIELSIKEAEQNMKWDESLNTCSNVPVGLKLRLMTASVGAHSNPQMMVGGNAPIWRSLPTSTLPVDLLHLEHRSRFHGTNPRLPPDQQSLNLSLQIAYAELEHLTGSWKYRNALQSDTTLAQGKSRIATCSW